ncbi:immunity protein Imm33 domain-containing protein, partial [Actinomyces gerencseriae]
VNPVDNGWRILSDADTDDFLNTPGNLVVASFNSIANIEPALIGIYTLPVGTDLQLVVHNGRRRWYDNTTGQDITDQL